MTSGLKQAIDLAKISLAKIPAYRKFLTDRGVNIRQIKNNVDFEKLPIASKTNYVHKYPLFDLVPPGRLPSQMHSSSGSSGQPTYWFRDLKNEKSGGIIHQQIFTNIFEFKKTEPTLVIICFSMGVWVAGGYTLSSCRWLSANGHNITCITPGIEKHDIFNILKLLAPNFSQVVLAGYPAFVMDILKEAAKTKIIPKGLKLLTAGDAFSEDWRQTALNFLGQKNPASIISLYGSADAGSIAFETPLSIFIKQKSLKNRDLYEKLFKNAAKEPTILQYLPDQIYLESINEEIVLTTNNTIPLVRYNIHDRGRIFTYDEMSAILEHVGLKKNNLRYSWNLPFVIQYGRTDVAVTFYALNVYPEHIQAGLKDKKIANLVSGNFKAYNQQVKNHSQENLHLEIEITEKTKPSKKVLDAVAKSIFSNLLRLNAEFRKLYGTIGEKALPQIKLIKQLQYSPSSAKTLISIKGKKPKMFI